MKNICRTLLYLMCFGLILLIGCAGPADGALPSDSAIDPIPSLRTNSATPEGAISFFVYESFVTSQELADSRMADVNALLRQHGITTPVALKRYSTAQRMDETTSKVVVHRLDAAWYRNFVEQGLLADLTDAINAFPDFKALWPDATWREVTIGGRIYGLPLILEEINQEDCALASSVLLRKDILEELQLPIPTMPEELIEASIKARDAGLPYRIAYHSNSDMPLYAFHRTYSEWPFYVDLDGLLIYWPDGSVTPYPGSDICAKDTTYRKMLLEEGLLLNTSLYNEDAAYTERFDCLAALYDMPAPPPRNAHYNDLEYVQFMPQAANFRIQPYGAEYIVASCEGIDPMQLIEVLQCIFTNQDIYDAFNYGKEGVDWKLEQDGSYTNLTGDFFVPYEYGPLIRPTKNAHLYTLENPLATPGTIIDFPAAFFRLYTPDGLYQNLVNSAAYEVYLVPYLFRAQENFALEDIITKLKEQGLDEVVSVAQEQFKAFLEG